MGYYTQKDRETIPFSYKFPLYSDHTKFKINVDTLWSINEKSTMEQRAECLTENPLGFTHPSQLPPLRVISFNEDQLEQWKQMRKKMITLKLTYSNYLKLSNMKIIK